MQGLILLIEDSPDIQRMIKKQLTHYGYEVEVQGDGASGLAWLATHRPDLVILDLMLPDMDGFEICTRIRQQHSANLLPILMLSALGQEVKDRVRGLKAGANDFMSKPYHLDELLARLETLIQVKKQHDQAETLVSRYVNQALRQEAALNPELVKQRQSGHGVILFADLRGFTHLSNTLPPETLVHLLDEFFDAMMQVIEEHGGVIFDIVGDEIMAVFNLPNPVPVPAYLAVQAALEMQELFRLLKIRWAAQGIEIGLGIGIEQGEVMVGNIGGNSLMRFTVIGSPVNYASRLLGLAQDGQVVVSRSIYQSIKLADHIQVISCPEVMLKGISQPQQVYQLSAGHSR